MRSSCVLILLAPVALGTAGCVVAPPPPPQPVVVAPSQSPPAAFTYQPVPQPRPERIPPPPRESVVWEPGHWHWNGAAYVWRPGHYVERTAAGTRFVPGEWQQRGGGWVWVPGHWI